MKKIMVFFLLVMSINLMATSDYDQWAVVVNPETGEEQTNGFEFDSNSMNLIRYHYYGEVSEWFDTSDPKLEEKASEWMKSIDQTFATGEVFNSNPIVNTVNTTIQNTIFEQKVVPLIEQEEMEVESAESAISESDKAKDKKGKKRAFALSSDLQYEMFEIADEEGSNASVRASIQKLMGNGKITYNGKLIASFVDYMDENELNLTLGGGAGYKIREEKNLEGIVGVDVNYINDNMVGESGYGASVYYFQRHFMNKNILSYGLVLNSNKVDVNSTFINAALMYGFPVGQRMALNIESIFSRNISYDGDTVDDPNLLNVGGTLSVSFTEAFGLTVGANTALLQEDYTSHTVNLGARYLF